MQRASQLPRLEDRSLEHEPVVVDVSNAGNVDPASLDCLIKLSRFASGANGTSVRVVSANGNLRII